MNHSTVITALDVEGDHEPWCREHDDPTLGGLIPAGPEDDLCRRPVLGAFDELLMTHNMHDGTLISLYGIRAELTLDEAEELFRAGLALIATAREAA